MLKLIKHLGGGGNPTLFEMDLYVTFILNM